jgi:hypothetical protein
LYKPEVEGQWPLTAIDFKHPNCSDTKRLTFLRIQELEHTQADPNQYFRIQGFIPYYSSEVSILVGLPSDNSPHLLKLVFDSPQDSKQALHTVVVVVTEVRKFHTCWTTSQLVTLPW